MKFPILVERIQSLMTYEYGEQTRICKAARTVPQTLNNIWNGHIPSAKILRDLAVALCTSTDYLVGLTDDPTPSHRRGNDEGQT